MTFPTSTISTANLDTGSSDPSLARADLKTTVEYMNAIITDKNTSNGVLVLDSGGRVGAALLPDTITSSTDNQLTLNPDNNIVKVQNYLRLQSIPKTTLLNVVGNAGDLAMCSDADGGNPALCIYNGTDWKYLPMASLTTVS